MSSLDKSSRQSICEQCKSKESKYTCPQCQLKTCSLPCVTEHKRITSCNGIRDKTVYTPTAKFTDLDLLSDYRFLEEAGRSLETYSRLSPNCPSINNKKLPSNLYRLMTNAASKGVTLKFLPPNFSKRKENSTFLDWKNNIIEWTVCWKLDWDKSFTATSKIPEGTILQDIVDKLLESDEIIFNKECQPLHVYFAAEYTPGQSGRYYEIDLGKTLLENLKDKTVVEFPIFYLTTSNNPSEIFPLVGTKLEAVKRKAPKNFFEVSEGELTDSD